MSNDLELVLDAIPDFMDGRNDWAADAVQAAIARIAALESALRAVEWAGEFGDCPSCGGAEPSRCADRLAHGGIVECQVGHKTDCALRAALIPKEQTS